MLPFPACTVYHGTNLFSAMMIQQYGICLATQRHLTDFGQGFYVTFNFKQAKNWAYIRASHPYQFHQKPFKLSKAPYILPSDYQKPACLAFRLDIQRLSTLYGMIFPLPNHPTWSIYHDAWKSFVAKCRAGKRHMFDYIYGPVGKMHPTCLDRIDLTIDKDQLSFNSSTALHCLTYARIITFKHKNPAMVSQYK